MEGSDEMGAPTKSRHCAREFIMIASAYSTIGQVRTFNGRWGWSFVPQVRVRTRKMLGRNKLVKRLQLAAQRLGNQRSDRALGESEESFRSLIENSTVGIYRTTPDGRILMANPALVRMLGYPDFEALASRSLQDEGFEPSYARDEFLKHIEKEGEIIGLEASWKKRDGSLIWVRESARAIRGPDGETLFYDGVVEDITQRKEQEQFLAESEEKFAKAFKCSPQPYTLSTLMEGRYLEINDAFVEKFGWSREETIGHTTAELRIWETPAEREKVVAQLLRGEPVSNTECRLRKKTGEMFNALLSAELLEIRGVQCVVMNAIDITAWKRTQDALYATEERAAAYFQQTMFAVIEWDDDFRVVEWNPAAESIFGYARDEVLGRHGQELIVGKDLAGKVNDMFRALMNHTGGEFSVNENITKRGGRIVCEWFNTPMVAQDGSVTGVISLVHNVTEQKVTENALRELSGRLISAQEEERKRVARELHDDIGQRLALVAIQLDRERQDLQASPEAMRLVMEEASKQVSHLASDMHSMSHRLHSSNLDMQGLAAAAGSFCQEVSEGQNVVVDFQSEGIPRTLSEDIALCLFRVLQEALQNATKHSGAKRFWVALAGSTDQIVLTVRDEGRGFQPEEAIRKRGLGLTSMMERLRLVGGELIIDTGPQSGTMIRACVPLSSHGKSVSAS